MKIGRNDPCWCGSGRKYKQCHEAFDRKMEHYAHLGHIVPTHDMLKTPEQMTSWDFFDYLLENANVVGTPGSGFGPSGEGYFRLTAFGTYENSVAALERIKAL